jgi:hypothetical protein
MILSAKHNSVVQKQGSRGSVLERYPSAKMKKTDDKTIPKLMEKQ